MVAGFNISNKCVVSVGLELPNPLEKTHFAHWEVFPAPKESWADRKALLSFCFSSSPKEDARAAQTAGSHANVAHCDRCHGVKHQWIISHRGDKQTPQ